MLMGCKTTVQGHGTKPVSVINRYVGYEDSMPLQDDDYLYLVMEYLAGGDVMVSAQQALRDLTP